MRKYKKRRKFKRHTKKEPFFSLFTISSSALIGLLPTFLLGLMMLGIIGIRYHTFENYQLTMPRVNIPSLSIQPFTILVISIKNDISHVTIPKLTITFHLPEIKPISRPSINFHPPRISINFKGFSQTIEDSINSFFLSVGEGGIILSRYLNPLPILTIFISLLMGILHNIGSTILTLISTCFKLVQIIGILFLESIVFIYNIIIMFVGYIYGVMIAIAQIVATIVLTIIMSIINTFTGIGKFIGKEISKTIDVISYVYKIISPYVEDVRKSLISSINMLSHGLHDDISVINSKK